MASSLGPASSYQLALFFFRRYGFVRRIYRGSIHPRTTPITSINHPVLPIYWGATNRRIADKLINAGTAEEFFELEAAEGKARFHQGTLTLLEDYVRDFVYHRNERLANGAPPARLYAPLVLWTLRDENGYRGQEKIKTVEIIQVVSFFDGENFSEIRRLPLTSIEIP